MILYRPIQWWADKINNFETFSLARFGDGEFLCMEGKDGGNSHGCAYTPELRQDLIDCAKDDRIYHGMQRITPAQFQRIKTYTESNVWLDTEVFADALAIGVAKPLFEAFSKKKVVIVSSKQKRAFSGFKYLHFIETPLTNTHLEKQRIIEECLSASYLHSYKGMVFLFACGMAAGPIISALHGNSKMEGNFLIDIGHILDPFIGDNSREYLKEVPVKTLMNNLP